MPYYIEKPIGKTPLDMVKLFQVKNPKNKSSQEAAFLRAISPRPQTLRPRILPL